MHILLQTCARSRCPSAVFAAIYNTLEHAVLKMSKWLQRGDCLRCTHAVALCIYSAFAHGDFPCVFGRCLPRMIKPLERCARPRQHSIFAPVQIQFKSIVFFAVKARLEAQNEHIAADVCEETVHSSSFRCYLQYFRACHVENEQTAAEGRRVTVGTCSFPMYLRCFRTSTSTRFLR